jgi:hypothetical protein
VHPLTNSVCCVLTAYTLLQVPCFVVLLAWDADRQNAGTPDGILRLLPLRRTTPESGPAAVQGACTSTGTLQATEVCCMLATVARCA